MYPLLRPCSKQRWSHVSHRHTCQTLAQYSIIAVESCHERISFWVVFMNVPKLSSPVCSFRESKIKSGPNQYILGNKYLSGTTQHGMMYFLELTSAWGAAISSLSGPTGCHKHRLDSVSSPETYTGMKKPRIPQAQAVRRRWADTGTMSITSSYSTRSCVHVPPHRMRPEGMETTDVASYTITDRTLIDVDREDCVNLSRMRLSCP